MKKNITNYQMIRFEESWSEQLVRLITKIAPILMLLGFAGLYIEMQTPGFGVPGIVGITCLALVFLSQYMVGLANHTEFLIITIGIMLLGIEMFVIPGFGVIGIAGIALMAAGMILSLQDFVLPKVPWERKLFEKNIMTVLGSLFSAFVVIIFFFRYAFPKISQVIHGPYLSADLASSRIDSDNSVNISVGDSGVVIKPLRPSGSVKIGDEVFDMISEGEYIDKGASVVITEIRANRIVVTRSSANDL